MSNVFRVAPQFWHEYLRRPPLAVFSMRLPHSGHAFWSCLIRVVGEVGMFQATINLAVSLAIQPDISLRPLLIALTDENKRARRVPVR